MVGAMIEKDWLVWIVVGGAGGVSVLSMLGVFANIIRYESQLHTLRNRVTDLQYEYALRIAKLHGQVADDDDEGEFEIIDDDPIEAGVEVVAADSEVPTPEMLGADGGGAEAAEIPEVAAAAA